MNTVSASKPKRRMLAVVALVVITLVVGVSLRLGRPVSDQDRYSGLREFGAGIQRAAQGNLSVQDRAVALLHRSSPSDYFRAGYEEQKEALLASGYLVELSVPIPNLKPQIQEIAGTLSRTGGVTTTFWQAAFDPTTDTVRLTCRAQDTNFWLDVLEAFQ